MGFKDLLKQNLDEAIQCGELPNNFNSSTITEMIFTSMLGASVHYGVNKSNNILDRSINSLIEYLHMIAGKEVLNHVR